MKRILAILAATTLAACSSSSAPPAAPPPAVEQPPAPPPIASGGTDLCRSRDFAYLVGRPRTEIPVPIQTYPPRRVTCTSCPVTMDFNPARLNILYDAETGIIRQVKCG